MKKIIAVALSLVLILSFTGLIASAKDFVYTTSIPTVYLAGQGTDLWSTPGYHEEDMIYPLEIPDGYIGDAAKGLIVPLLEGIAVDNWDEYCEKLTDALVGIVGAVGLDENGEPAPNEHPWINNPNKTIITADGRYTLYSHSHPGEGYYFNYDWRTDPYALADQLNDYITKVKAKTGFEKVNLVGRCLGVNIILTYLSKYGNGSIEKTVLVSGGLDFFEAVGTLFSGKFKFDPDAIARFGDEYLRDGDYTEDPMYASLDVLIRLLNQMSALGYPVSLADKFSEKVLYRIAPDVLLSSYGTMPSFWTFVGNDFYEEAKAYMFAGKEEQYKGLIEKIDRYHYDIGQRHQSIIDEANAAGNQVSIIAKYGLQIIPTIENSDIMADGYLETVSSSFGATCSTIDGTLSKAYLQAAEENGTAKYVSPDKQIDASTCKYPDRTWFVKLMPHMDNPDPINDIICGILDYDGDMTVFDNPELPQYMLYDKATDSVTALTSENGQNNTSNWSKGKLANLFELIINFLKMLFARVKDLF